MTTLIFILITTCKYYFAFLQKKLIAHPQIHRSRPQNVPRHDQPNKSLAEMQSTIRANIGFWLGASWFNYSIIHLFSNLLRACEQIITSNVGSFLILTKQVTVIY
jgi:hypothetical protein